MAAEPEKPANHEEDAARLATKAALVITLAAIALGLLYKALLGHPPVDPVAHSGGYGRIARNLLELGLYSLDGRSPTAFRPPAYPLALVPIVALPAPLRIVAFVVAQGAFFFVAARIGASLVLRMGGGRWAVAVYGLLLVGHLRLVDETLEARETLLFAALLMSFLDAVASSRPRTRDAMALGLVFGALALTRPTGLPIGIAAWLFGVRMRAFEASRRRQVAVAAIAAIVSMAPWQTYLATRFGTAVPAGTSTSGLNLLKGNNPSFDRYYPWVDVDVVDGAADRAVPASTDEAVRDAAMRTLGLRYAASAPLTTVRRMAEKTLALFSPVEIPCVGARVEGPLTDLTVETLPIPRMRKLDLVLRALGPSLLGVGVVVGLVLMRRSFRDDRFVAAFGRALLMLVLLHAMTFAETRFRLPFDFGFAALAALGLCALARSIATSRAGPGSAMPQP